MDVGCRGPRPLLQTGVRQDIDHHMVVGPHKPLHRGIPCLPARGIQHHLPTIEKRGQLALQPDGVGGVAQQGGRPRTVRSERLDGIHRSLLDLRVR